MICSLPFRAISTLTRMLRCAPWQAVSGVGSGNSYGALVSVGQMIVSEDDIRRISQELYNLIQTGSRAQGRFSTA